MFKFVSPTAGLSLWSRVFQLVVVFGVAAPLTAALTGAASALPPDPCDFCVHSEYPPDLDAAVPSDPANFDVYPADPCEFDAVPGDPI